MEKPLHAMTLDELCARFDGPIPDDLKRMAAGLNLPLQDARGAVRFWTHQFEHLKRAIQNSPDRNHRLRLQGDFDQARAMLTAAKQRVAELEQGDAA